MKTFKNKMIIHLTTGLLVLVFTSSAMAQGTAIGIRFMPTFANLEMKTSTGGKVEGQVSLGYGFGMFLGYHFSDNVGVQGELMYTSINQKYKEQDIERKVSLQYVNIPLLLSLNTGKSKLINVNLVIGPQIGINAGAKVASSGNDTTNAMISVKAGDLGIAYGAGIDFRVNKARTLRFGIGYRGVLGLFDISDNSQSSATNSFYIIDRTQLKTHAGYIGISYMF